MSLFLLHLGQLTIHDRSQTATRLQRRHTRFVKLLAFENSFGSICMKFILAFEEPVLVIAV